jgi:hypothetical protein
MDEVMDTAGREERFAARQARLRAERENRGATEAAQAAAREQRHAEYLARQERLAREREATAMAAAEYARAEAARHHAAALADTGPHPQVPATGGGTATKDEILTAITELAAAGDVEEAGWIIRSWALRTRDTDLEKQLASLLGDTRRISHVPTGEHRPRAVLGCGTRLLKSHARGATGHQVWLQCVALFGIPLLPVRAGLRDGRRLRALVPLTPAARRARLVVPMLTLAVAAGVLVELLNRLLVGSPAGMVRGTTVAVAVVICGLVVAGGLTLGRTARCFRWLDEHRAP